MAGQPGYADAAAHDDFSTALDDFSQGELMGLMDAVEAEAEGELDRHRRLEGTKFIRYTVDCRACDREVTHTSRGKSLAHGYSQPMQFQRHTALQLMSFCRSPPA